MDDFDLALGVIAGAASLGVVLRLLKLRRHRATLLVGSAALLGLALLWWYRPEDEFLDRNTLAIWMSAALITAWAVVSLVAVAAWKTTGWVGDRLRRQSQNYAVTDD